MGVIMEIQGDFEMHITTLAGEALSEQEEKEVVERLQTGEYFATMERRKIVDYAGGDWVDVYNFSIEPCDHTEYRYEHFNEL